MFTHFLLYNSLVKVSYNYYVNTMMYKQISNKYDIWKIISGISSCVNNFKINVFITILQKHVWGMVLGSYVILNCV